MTKNLIIIITAFFIFSACNQTPALSDLELKEGIYHLQDSPEPYTGQVQEQYVSGEDSMVATIHNGLFHGAYLNYYRNGNIKDSICYNKGMITNMFHWYEDGTNGKVDKKNLERNKDGFWQAKDVAGNELFTGIAVDSNNVENGTNYILLSSYKKGELHGLMIKYYLNGQICFSRTFKNGIKHGYYTSYYEDGTKRGEGLMQNGKEEGRWVWYKKNGTIDEDDIYKNGSYQTNCDCCNNDYWSEEGWSSVPHYMSTRVYSPSQNGGPYCSEGCAIECR